LLSKHCAHTHGWIHHWGVWGNAQLIVMLKHVLDWFYDTLRCTKSPVNDEVRGERPTFAKSRIHRYTWNVGLTVYNFMRIRRGGCRRSCRRGDGGPRTKPPQGWRGEPLLDGSGAKCPR